MVHTFAHGSSMSLFFFKRRPSVGRNKYTQLGPVKILIHQEFQVPKMEGFGKNLIYGYFGGWVFPYLSRIHTACIGFCTSILA